MREETELIWHWCKYSVSSQTAAGPHCSPCSSYGCWMKTSISVLTPGPKQPSRGSGLAHPAEKGEAPQAQLSSSSLEEAAVSRVRSKARGIGYSARGLVGLEQTRSPHTTPYHQHCIPGMQGQSAAPPIPPCSPPQLPIGRMNHCSCRTTGQPEVIMYFRVFLHPQQHHTHRPAILTQGAAAPRPSWEATPSFSLPQDHPPATANPNPQPPSPPLSRSPRPNSKAKNRRTGRKGSKK